MVSFVDDLKKVVDRVVEERGYSSRVKDGSIDLSYYDDFPASDGASVSIHYTAQDGPSLVDSLVAAFGENSFQVIGIARGY